MRVKRHFKTTCRRPPSQNVSAQQEGNVFGPLDPNDQIQVSSLKAFLSFVSLVFSRKMVDDVGVPSGWFSFDCLYCHTCPKFGDVTVNSLIGGSSSENVGRLVTIP